MGCVCNDAAIYLSGLVTPLPRQFIVKLPVVTKPVLHTGRMQSWLSFKRSTDASCVLLGPAAGAEPTGPRGFHAHEPCTGCGKA